MNNCCFAFFFKHPTEELQELRRREKSRHEAALKRLAEAQQRFNMCLGESGAKWEKNATKNPRCFFLGVQHLLIWVFFKQHFGRLKMREFGCWRLLFLAPFCCYIVLLDLWKKGKRLIWIIFWWGTTSKSHLTPQKDPKGKRNQHTNILNS